MPAISKRLRHAAAVVSSVSLGLILQACGHGGGGTQINTPVAFSEIGQADFASAASNRGGATSALGLAQPLGGIATDGAKFYVADYSNNRVLGWNAIPSAPTKAADFVIGQADFTGSAAGTGAGQLALPSSVYVANGHLIVADSGNNRVLIWNSLPTTNVPADLVLGTGASGNASNQLASPVAASIANNKVFVADQGNNRVLIWNNLSTLASGQAADIELGQPGFNSSVVGLDEQNGLNNPAGLWTDGLRLLVSDSGNNRVMYWASVPTASNTDATYVIGQSDFSRTAAGVGQSSLRTPYGIASDGTRIFVADAGNNRVLEFDSFPLASGEVAGAVFGQNTYTASTSNDDNQNGTTDTVNGVVTPSDRTLSSPTGVTDLDNVLYVTDRSNHRIMFYAD